MALSSEKARKIAGDESARRLIHEMERHLALRARAAPTTILRYIQQARAARNLLVQRVFG
ncbi:MAG: hypothetical protein ABR985_22045 [Methanotrichaceae archaeon]|jgi:hypothetical protein